MGRVLFKLLLLMSSLLGLNAKTASYPREFKEMPFGIWHYTKCFQYKNKSNAKVWMMLAIKRHNQAGNVSIRHFNTNEKSSRSCKVFYSKLMLGKISNKEFEKQTFTGISGLPKVGWFTGKGWYKNFENQLISSSEDSLVSAKALQMYSTDGEKKFIFSQSRQGLFISFGTNSLNFPPQLIQLPSLVDRDLDRLMSLDGATKVRNNSFFRTLLKNEKNIFYVSKHEIAGHKLCLLSDFNKLNKYLGYSSLNLTFKIPFVLLKDNLLPGDRECEDVYLFMSSSKLTDILDFRKNRFFRKIQVAVKKIKNEKIKEKAAKKISVAFKNYKDLMQFKRSDIELLERFKKISSKAQYDTKKVITINQGEIDLKRLVSLEYTSYDFPILPLKGDIRKKPLALILYPEEDWNGAYHMIYKFSKKFVAALSYKYNIKFVRVGSVKAIKEQLGKLPDHSVYYLVLGGHGSGQIIELGANQKVLGPKLSSDLVSLIRLKMQKHNSPGAADSTENKGIIVLDGCSSGSLVAKDSLMIEFISHFPDLTIIAPTEVLRVSAFDWRRHKVKMYNQADESYNVTRIYYPKDYYPDPRFVSQSSGGSKESEVVSEKVFLNSLHKHLKRKLSFLSSVAGKSVRNEFDPLELAQEINNSNPNQRAVNDLIRNFMLDLASEVIKSTDENLIASAANFLGTLAWKSPRCYERLLEGLGVTKSYFFVAVVHKLMQDNLSDKLYDTFYKLIGQFSVKDEIYSALIQVTKEGKESKRKLRVLKFNTFLTSLLENKKYEAVRKRIEEVLKALLV